MLARACLKLNMTAWSAETRRVQLMNQLEGSQRQLAEERERMQTKIMELEDNVAAANKEISRLVCHIHSLAIGRCKKLRALVQPLALPPRALTRECFFAWKRARGWIREELRSTLLHGELAWKEGHERFLIAEIEKGEGWAMLGASEASHQAYKIMQQQWAFDAERDEWKAERASLFAQHCQAVVTLTAQFEEKQAQLMEQHKAEAEAWSAEEKRLNDRKVFLEGVVEEGLAEEHGHYNGRAKFPVLPKSCGTVCIACRRRILGQAELPNHRPKSAGHRSPGSKSTGSLPQSTVDSCVHDLLAPQIVRLIGNQVNAVNEMVEYATADMKGKPKKQGGWLDKHAKEQGSISPSPYAVPLSLGSAGGTRPAAGHPLNARAALLRQN
jgi:hypothetical protein